MHSYANAIFRGAGSPGHGDHSLPRQIWCTIVIPCYNEADRLSIEHFTDCLDSQRNIRFLFVNDGSTDGTVEVINRFRLRYPATVSLLSLRRNVGKAEAVRCGMLFAIGLPDSGFVGFWDADLATPLGSIPDMLATLKGSDDTQMVFGSRVRLLGRRICRKASRHYIGRAFATAVSIVLRIPIYDTQCGAKLFKVTPRLLEILRDPFMSRWIFDVELIARYLSSLDRPINPENCGIQEVPLYEWRDIGGSKLKALDFIIALFELIKIYLSRFRARTPTIALPKVYEPAGFASAGITETCWSGFDGDTVSPLSSV